MAILWTSLLYLQFWLIFNALVFSKKEFGHYKIPLSEQKKMSSHTIVGQVIILNRQWLSFPSLVSQILCTLFWHPMSSTWVGIKGTLVLWASISSTFLLIAGQFPGSLQLWYPCLAAYQNTGANPLGITIFDVSWGASNTWARKC